MFLYLTRSLDFFLGLDLNCNCFISMKLSLKSDLMSVCLMSLELILL